MQKLVDAVSSSGMSITGMEPGVWAGARHCWLVGATGAQCPMILTSLPVKDSAKAAQKQLAKMTTSADGEAWAQQEKDGVKYFFDADRGKSFLDHADARPVG